MVNKGGFMKSINFLAITLIFHATIVMAIDTSQLQPPTPPKYETCQILSTGQDPACLARNRALENQYSQQLAAYQRSLALTQQAQVSSASSSSNTPTQSTTALINQAQQQSTKASSSYNILSIGCYATSAVFAGLFAASCAHGCNGALAAASAGFAVLGMMSGSRSNKAANNADQMCTASQQLSNTASCQNTGTTSGTPGGPSGTGTITTYFDPNTGACKVDPATCNQITSTLPKGTNIKDALNGLSAFATGSKNAPFKINPDGSVTTKNGKTFKPSDFGSQESMIAAGIPPSVAGDIASDFKKMSAAVGSGTDAQASGNGKDGTDGALGNSGGDAGGGGVVKNAEAESNGDANLAAKDMDGKGNRNPASDSADGLVKDFNGELIGAAGDDIFKMMNRRYNLKAAQDSFLAP